MAVGFKRQRYKTHAARVEIFVNAAIRIDTVEATHDKLIHHVNHGLGYIAIDVFKSINTFLNDDFADFQTFFHHGHFIALFTVKSAHIIGGSRRQNPHAIGTCIRLDDDKWFFLNAIFLILDAHFVQHRLHIGGQTFFTFLRAKIHFATLAEDRVNEPRIDANNFCKVLSHAVIGVEVQGFATGRPARIKRRHHLLLQPSEQGRHACR